MPSIQVGEANNMGLADSAIFIDKESGKDFGRTNYQKLKRRLKPSDVLFVKSIDRLGRDYAMILDEWRELTKEKGILNNRAASGTNSDNF